MKKLSYPVLLLAAVLLLGACDGTAGREADRALIDSPSSETQPAGAADGADGEEAVPDTAEQEWREGDGPPILSITLSAEVGDGLVETSVTEEAQTQWISARILEQEPLENVEDLILLEGAAAITAKVQDGPGSNFKLILYPATSVSLGGEILVIQGELISFFTDSAAYGELLSLLLEQAGPPEGELNRQGLQMTPGVVYL